MTALPKFLTHPDTSIYRKGNYVLLDFETTNLDKGDPLNPNNRIVTAVWYSSKDDEWRHNAANEFDQPELCRDVLLADFIVAHNAKFELGWLVRCGIEPRDLLVYDTLVSEYVLGGNRWQFGALSLESISQRRYGEGKSSIVSGLIKSGVCPSEIPSRWLEDYCRRDCELTQRLFEDQLNELDDALLAIVYSRCLVTPVLADLEGQGLKLDAEKVLARYKELVARQKDLSEQLKQEIGEINFDSTLQLAAALYDTLGFKELTKRGEPIRTAGGKRSTSADTISQLKATTRKQKLVLSLFKEQREVSSELSKYLHKFEDCVKEANGVLFASFNQTNTQTHRLSSSGKTYRTQFQNLPRNLKPLFKAKKEGWLIGEVDGAQLEFRVAGHLGRDERVLQDLLEKHDVHKATASQLEGVPMDKVTKEQRQDAKSRTFKPLYGGRSGTPDEQAYYKYFRERYKGVTEAQNRWINEVLTTGKLRTEWGLIFYWPDTTMSRTGYVSNTTSICNYPVQSFATADIIPLSLVFFWHRIKANNLQMRIVNTVHDSIIVELPPDEVESFYSLARQCLIDDVYPALKSLYSVDLCVPLGAEAAVGEHWGGKSEVRTYDAEPELYRLSQNLV